jgi:excisionase family DNA binding protein
MTRELPAPLLDMLLTTKELARVLKCGETKAKELVKTGEIPSLKISGLRRVRMRDLATWLDSQEPSPPSQKRAA